MATIGSWKQKKAHTFTHIIVAYSSVEKAAEEANMSERHIDISRSNYSVIDNEFGNMRDRFEAEMRRVEDEMKRLRQEFEGYRPGAPPPAISNQTYSQSAHNEPRRQEPFGGKPLSL
ncbi:hypothetical protein NECAME_11665, partial [Necator americanus]